MSDTGPVTMRAVFLGGPADGGELVLAEPVRGLIRFPAALSLVDVAETDELAPRIPVVDVRHTPASVYALHLDPDTDRPWLNRGRLIYLYRLPVTTPPEGSTDD